MQLSAPLCTGVLVRRYKRFLADVTLASGEMVTVHCPNPGAMTGLIEAPRPVIIQRMAGNKRKLAYGWRLVHLPSAGWVGVDTTLVNRLVAEALATKAIPALAAYDNVRREVMVAPGTRLDFHLDAADKSGCCLPDCYLEVKNVHLSRRAGLAEFPDSKTVRGARHLRVLARLRAAGHRAVVLFVVQRADCTGFSIAHDIDPVYAQAWHDACAQGVETICHGCVLTPCQITLGGSLSVCPSALAGCCGHVVVG